LRTYREKSGLKELQENDSTRVLIRTLYQQLRQIPWHLWDLVEEYPNAELALSASDYQKAIAKGLTRVREPSSSLGNSCPDFWF
jgi:hypothetical protein